MISAKTIDLLHMEIFKIKPKSNCLKVWLTGSIKVNSLHIRQTAFIMNACSLTFALAL